jgi:hypothetical protein
MSLHSETLSWFRANQSLLFLLNAAFLSGNQHIPIVLSLAWPDRGYNPWSTALEASTLTITPPMNPWSTTLEASTLTITPPVTYMVDIKSLPIAVIVYYVVTMQICFYYSIIEEIARYICTLLVWWSLVILW